MAKSYASRLRDTEFNLQEMRIIIKEESRWFQGKTGSRYRKAASRAARLEKQLRRLKLAEIKRLARGL